MTTVSSASGFVCTLFLVFGSSTRKATWSLYLISYFVIPLHLGLKILNLELAHSERAPALCPGDRGSNPAKNNI